MNTPF